MRRPKFFVDKFIAISVSLVLVNCDFDTKNNLVIQNYNQGPYGIYILSNKDNLSYKEIRIDKDGKTIYNAILDQTPCKIDTVLNDTVHVEYYTNKDSIFHANTKFETVVKYELRHVKGTIAVENKLVDSVHQSNADYYFFCGNEVDTVKANSLLNSGTVFFTSTLSNAIRVSTKYSIQDKVFIDKFYIE